MITEHVIADQIDANRTLYNQLVENAQKNQLE